MGEAQFFQHVVLEKLSIPGKTKQNKPPQNP